jgi:hypothetical protein
MPLLAIGHDLPATSNSLSEGISVKAILAAAIALLVPFAALASSEDAWTGLDKAARAACLTDAQKSDNAMKALGDVGTVTGIGGKDGDQFYALIFRSQTSRQPHYLCLYDKVSKKAQAGIISPF